MDDTICVSSAASFGSAGVASVSDTFSSLNLRASSGGSCSLSNRVARLVRSTVAAMARSSSRAATSSVSSVMKLDLIQSAWPEKTDRSSKVRSASSMKACASATVGGFWGSAANVAVEQASRAGMSRWKRITSRVRQAHDPANPREDRAKRGDGCQAIGTRILRKGNRARRGFQRRRVRHRHDPPGARLAEALLRQWPEYLSYVTTFLTVLIMWMNRHKLFRHIHRINHPFLVLNGLLLMSVTLVPFPTALLAAYIGHTGERTAEAVYSGWFVVIAIFFNLLWRYASSRGRFLARNSTRPPWPPSPASTASDRCSMSPPSGWRSSTWPRA